MRSAAETQLLTISPKEKIEWFISNRSEYTLQIVIRNEPFQSDASKYVNEPTIITLKPHQNFAAELDNVKAQGAFYIDMKFLDTPSGCICKSQESIHVPAERDRLSVYIQAKEDRAGQEFWPPYHWIVPKMHISQY